MFFIFYFPAQAPRKLYRVSKESWCGIHALLTGVDLHYYEKHNLLQTTVFEPTVILNNGDEILFATRKNWFKLAMIMLLVANSFLYFTLPSLLKLL